jgi:hypothetical protein
VKADKVLSASADELGEIRDMHKHLIEIDDRTSGLFQLFRGFRRKPSVSLRDLVPVVPIAALRETRVFESFS